VTEYDQLLVHMRNETMSVTKEERERANDGRSSGDYYIGVYGFTHAVYALLV
jgi:hypothetical protein